MKKILALVIFLPLMINFTLSSFEIKQKFLSDLADKIQTQNKITIENPVGSSHPIEDNIGDMSKYPKSINDYANWIKSTSPADNSKNVSPYSGIKIEFAQDMNQESLNTSTIFVLECKHNHNISEIFNYEYDTKTRILDLKFKDPNSSYGSGNGITVTLSKNIENSKNEKLGVDLSFGFSGE